MIRHTHSGEKILEAIQGAWIEERERVRFMADVISHAPQATSHNRAIAVHMSSR